MSLDDRDYMRPGSRRRVVRHAPFSFDPASTTAHATASPAPSAGPASTSSTATSGEPRSFSRSIRRIVLTLLAFACMLQCVGVLVASAFGVVRLHLEVGDAPVRSAVDLYLWGSLTLLACIAALCILNMLLFRPLRIRPAFGTILALVQPILVAGATAYVITGLAHAGLDWKSWPTMADILAGSRAAQGVAEHGYLVSESATSLGFLVLLTGLVVAVPAFALAGALPYEATPGSWWLAIDRGDTSTVMYRVGYLQLLPLVLLAMLARLCHVADATIADFAFRCLGSSWAPIVAACLLALPSIAVMRRSAAIISILSSDRRAQRLLKRTRRTTA